MNRFGCFFILVIIGVIAYLTNPSKQAHLDNAYEMINAQGSEFFGGDVTLKLLEETVGKERMLEFIKPFIHTKNYLLFSLTQISIGGEDKTIAVGAFGMFWGEEGASTGGSGAQSSDSLRDRVQDFLKNGAAH